MSKNVILIGTTVAVVTTLLLVLAGNPITMKGFERIEMGMSHAEVEKILGQGRPYMEMLAEYEQKKRERPKNSDSEPPSTVLSLLDGLEGPPATRMMDVYHFTTYVWARGDDEAIFVSFDDDDADLVAAKVQIGLAEPPSGEFDGLGVFDLRRSKTP